MRSTFLQAGQEIQKRKIALGFFIISVFYILGSFTIGLVCSNASICSFSSGLGRTPLNLLFVLLTFIPIWIGVWVDFRKSRWFYFFVFVVFFVRSVGVATVLFPVQRTRKPVSSTNQSIARATKSRTGN